MRKKKNNSALLNPFNLAHHGSGESLYSAEAFRAVVERERLRCDRNNHAFSLAVLAMDGTWKAAEFPPRFIETLPHLVRCTDEVGWLDGRRIGVMLPETHAPGAWRFCEKVREAMKTFGLAVVFQVFSYPSPSLPGNEVSDPRQMWFEGIMSLAGESAAEHDTDGAKMSSFWRYTPAAVTAGGAAEPYALGDIAELLVDRMPFGKRAADVLGALAALILCAPVMLLIALVIKLQSSGPVFFRQQRIGYLGRPFPCWKFRTMRVKASEQMHESHVRTLIGADAPMMKLDMQEDPRLIPVGRILRLSGLDELPQLINVLRGEMSLIGPRPCIPYEYRTFQLWHRRRNDIMPGLTGLWQVNGKNRTTFTEMMRMDIAYIRHNCLWLDLLIVLRTVPALVVQMRDGLARQIDQRRVRTLVGRAWDAALPRLRTTMVVQPAEAVFKTRE